MRLRSPVLSALLGVLWPAAALAHTGKTSPVDFSRGCDGPCTTTTSSSVAAMPRPFGLSLPPP